MKRLMLLIPVVLLAACSSGSDTAAPTWEEQMVPASAVRQEISGRAVWVDETARMIYVEDCDTARSLTGSGGQFGASRNADGSNPKNGYGYICP